MTTSSDHQKSHVVVTFPIGTATSRPRRPRRPQTDGCERLRTVADVCGRLRTQEAGSREHGSTPRPPNVKREPFATHLGEKKPFNSYIFSWLIYPTSPSRSTAGHAARKPLGTPRRRPSPRCARRAVAPAPWWAEAVARVDEGPHVPRRERRWHHHRTKTPNSCNAPEKRWSWKTQVLDGFGLICQLPGPTNSRDCFGVLWWIQIVPCIHLQLCRGHRCRQQTSWRQVLAPDMETSANHFSQEPLHIASILKKQFTGDRPQKPHIYIYILYIIYIIYKYIYICIHTYMYAYIYNMYI